MSATISTPAPGRWLGRLLARRPHQVIGPPEHPYLLRYFVLPHNPVLNVYLHRFVASDDPDALHDHPWPFVSLCLAGRYREVRPGGRVALRRPGTVAVRRAATRHRVELLPDNRGGERACWTVLVTGPKVREWGFWCRDRFVPWTTFDGGCGEVQ